MTRHQPWHAQMIAPDAELDGAPLLRKAFELDDGHGPVVNATLRASSLGIYEAWVNGHAADDDVLSPGWSSYEWRVRYRSYDVTALITDVNVLGMSLGNGWYRGRLGFQGQEHIYGDELAAFAELEIVFDDGHRQLVTTDDTWRARASATTSNQLYDGQSIDARRDPVGPGRGQGRQGRRGDCSAVPQRTPRGGSSRGPRPTTGRLGVRRGG